MSWKASKPRLELGRIEYRRSSPGLSLSHKKAVNQAVSPRERNHNRIPRRTDGVCQSRNGAAHGGGSRSLRYGHITDTQSIIRLLVGSWTDSMRTRSWPITPRTPLPASQTSRSPKQTTRLSSRRQTFNAFEGRWKEAVNDKSRWSVSDHQTSKAIGRPLDSSEPARPFMDRLHLGTVIGRNCRKALTLPRQASDKWLCGSPWLRPTETYRGNIRVRAMESRVRGPQITVIFATSWLYKTANSRLPRPGNAPNRHATQVVGCGGEPRIPRPAAELCTTRYERPSRLPRHPAGQPF